MCPSCAGRRMAEMAAHLVDSVIPRVPVRQWVLSLPWALRFALARDARLLGAAVRVFIDEIFRDLRRRAGLGSKVECGAVTGVQRFGGSLNLNVHPHVMVLDGVYRRDPETGELGFRKLRPPTLGDLEGVLSRTQGRIERLLKGKGYGEREGEDPSALEVAQAASVRGWVALTALHPRPTHADGKGDLQPIEEKPFCVTRDGWSLEAGVRIRAGDRAALERLCRYILRPPFAEERVNLNEEGDVVYEFRRPRRDGTTRLVMTGVEFVEKLAALVPPPRSPLLRYHGVLAPRSRTRSRVVPGAGPRPGCGSEVRKAGRPRPPDRPRRPEGRSSMGWAALLRRSMDVDALDCPRCHGRMEVIATIEEPGVIRRILASLGLPTETPRASPARPPPRAFGIDHDSSQDFDVA